MASHIVYGAGVYSPGKWRVADRIDVAPTFSKAMRQVLEVGVNRWSSAVGSEPRQLLFSLAAGKHAELDVPIALVDELVGQVWALVGHAGHEEAPGGTAARSTST